MGSAVSLVVGIMIGGAIFGPGCYWYAQLQRARLDRRTAWATHKALVFNRIPGLFAKVAGMGALSLFLLVVGIIGHKH